MSGQYCRNIDIDKRGRVFASIGLIGIFNTTDDAFDQSPNQIM